MNTFCKWLLSSADVLPSPKSSEYESPSKTLYRSLLCPPQKMEVFDRAPIYLSYLQLVTLFHEFNKIFMQLLFSKVFSFKDSSWPVSARLSFSSQILVLMLIFFTLIKDDFTVRLTFHYLRLSLPLYCQVVNSQGLNMHTCWKRSYITKRVIACSYQPRSIDYWCLHNLHV